MSKGNYSEQIEAKSRRSSENDSREEKEHEIIQGRSLSCKRE